MKNKVSGAVWKKSLFALLALALILALAACTAGESEPIEDTQTTDEGISSGDSLVTDARKPLDESGAADKNLRYLVEGDQIQTVHYATAISSSDDELTAVPIDTITVTPEISFAETELGDGLFIMMYIMQDSQGNVAYSAPVTFETTGGEIITSVE